MFKHLVAAVVLFSGIVSSVALLEATVLAQEFPVCFMTRLSGEVVDLTDMCSRRQPQVLIDEKEMQELYKQVDSLYKSGRFKEAINKLSQVVNMKPNSPEIYAYRGNLRLGAGDVQGSLADLQRSLDLYRAKGNLESSSILQEQISAIRGSL